MIGFYVGAGLGIAAGALVLDAVLRAVLRRLGPLLDNDLCGPGGWYIDTAEGRGIFDGALRQRGGDA